MRKRVQIIVAVLFVRIAGVVGLRMFYPRTREPVYQGKALRVWLYDYLGWDTTPGEWAQAKNKAEYAVRQIGTNAIPTLTISCSPGFVQKRAATLNQQP